MIIDIFTYTQATPNAPFGIEALIEAAKCARLDGIAVTDRGSSCRAREYAAVAQRENFLVLHGVELETNGGRVVAFPAVIDDDYVSEDWRSLGENPEVEAVLEYFHERGGIVIARDIYNRGEGLKDRVYSAKDSNGRGFDGVDTVSVYRRRIDNELSIEAQQVLKVPACAGSGVFDEIQDIGHCATLFAQQIMDQKSFVAAMMGTAHWACALRDLGPACPMGSEPKSEDNERRVDSRRPRHDRGDRREGRGRDNGRRDGRRDGGREGGRSERRPNNRRNNHRRSPRSE